MKNMLTKAGAVRVVDDLIALQQCIVGPLEHGLPDVDDLELEKMHRAVGEVIGTIYTDLLYDAIIAYPELDPDTYDEHTLRVTTRTEARRPAREVAHGFLSACSKALASMGALETFVEEHEGRALGVAFARAAVDSRSRMEELRRLAEAWVAGERS